MDKHLRVLILEDSENDAMLLTRKLKQAGYDLIYRRVENADEMHAALNAQSWDILVSDHSMPHFSAIKALEILKEKAIDLPVIIVSGTIESEKAVAAMKAGASDFIMKNDLTRLIPAIERELREAANRQARRKAELEFYQAQKMESVGRLAGGVAHDFNNLLTAIMGYANFLSRGLTDTWCEDVEEIRKAAQRAAALTGQLLAFSRRQVLQPKVIDLNSEVVDVEKMLQRILGEDIQWKTQLSRDLWRVNADPGQIQQVIMNLAVNARDAMPQGGKIIVATENVELESPLSFPEFTISSGAYVVLSVTDTGVGMDEAIKSQIFEPFFTTKEKGKGTGLGLAMVYGVVKQSNGYVTVESTLNKGSTFRVYLPRVMKKLTVKNGEEFAVKSLSGSETVLVVDDDASIRRLLQRILSEKGYSVSVAGSAKEAMELIRKQGPSQLLVTDVILPDINGLELAKQMVAAYPSLKIIHISGYMDRDFGTFVMNDKTPYLQKPFTAKSLLELVREVLDDKIKPSQTK